MGPLGFREMATGGLVTRPTAAIVGEAGPEAVVPLDRFESLVESSVDLGGDTGTGFGPGRQQRELLDELKSIKGLMERAVENGGDIVLEIDGTRLAETTERANDRFLQRREVNR